jgi:EAL domain-containing protein (putative c-di-GMP-specific phosphodiesterase class I)
MGLRRAIEASELRLHFQPLVSLRERRTIGFESLVRWQHPERGLLAPAEFIPVAEESDLILEVGEWVLREACRQMADWQKRLAPDPPFFQPQATRVHPRLGQHTPHHIRKTRIAHLPR